MDIRDMETFVKVVQTGSLSRAAELLHLTQPGVSKRIRHIEGELGCRLFERVGNLFQLTSGGRLAYESVQDMLGSLANLREQLAVQDGRLTTLTIALSNSLGHSAFTAQMRHLQAQFPFLEHLHLRLLSSGKVSESVLQGDSDVGVRFFRDDETRLTYEEICREQLVIVYPADSKWLPQAEPITTAHLCDAPWITLPLKGASSSSVTILAQFLDQQLANLGIRPRTKIEIDGFHSAKTMVTSDFGLALLPVSHVQDDVEKGTLLALPPPFVASIPIYCVYRKNYHHIETLQEVVSFLFHRN
jgi:DNA-binding transcriptional LysR family regulator